MTTRPGHRLEREYIEHLRDPPPGCTAKPEEGDIFSWTAVIRGPDDTPFAGGHFKLTMHFSRDYPQKAPRVRFMTKVYHPNVKDESGSIGLMLEEVWTSVCNIHAILLSLQSLLTDPYTVNSLMPEIARQHEEDREEYNKTAKEWTRLSAQQSDL